MLVDVVEFRSPFVAFVVHLVNLDWRRRCRRQNWSRETFPLALFSFLAGLSLNGNRNEDEDENENGNRSKNENDQLTVTLRLSHLFEKWRIFSGCLMFLVPLKPWRLVYTESLYAPRQQGGVSLGEQSRLPAFRCVCVCVLLTGIHKSHTHTRYNEA